MKARARDLGNNSRRTNGDSIFSGELARSAEPSRHRRIERHGIFHRQSTECVRKFANHPGICAGYRLFTSSGSVAYLPDNEPYEPLKIQFASRDGISEEEARDFAAAERAKVVEFLQDCDVVILDAQYTDEEYSEHVGWGHGSLSSVVSLALDARARKLVLFHHDPNHDDEMVDAMTERARALAAKSGKTLEIEAAREGAELCARREDFCYESPVALVATAQIRLNFSPLLPRSVMVAPEILDLFV